MDWLCFDGSTHPVSSRFLAIVPQELSGRPYQQIEAERQFLLQMPAKIADEIRPRLRALDHVRNINSALRWLGGRDYRSSNDAFGPGGTICQVHGNAWVPDTCECRLSFMFDHWIAMDWAAYGQWCADKEKYRQIAAGELISLATSKRQAKTKLQGLIANPVPVPPEIVTFPHSAGVKRCERHAQLTDFRDHYFEVLRENRLVNLNKMALKHPGRV